MKEIAAETYTIQEEEEEPRRLSFCDLPSTLHSPATPSARPDLLFEFSATHTPAAAHSYYNDIVFCGKIIHDDEQEGDHYDDDLNEYQKRDYFATVKSQSLRKPSSPEYDSDNRRLSASTRHSGELARPKCSDLDYHAQRVNISSLTSMSAKSRRRMFMFGPVKFKPEMELSAIKQRQTKLAAADKTAESKGQWGLLKSSFKGRSHLTTMLARSLGCIPVAGGAGGFERRLGAAN